MQAKKIQPAQITDKTYVFFNILLIQVLYPDLHCKTGLWDLEKIAGDFFFRSLTIDFSASFYHWRSCMIPRIKSVQQGKILCLMLFLRTAQEFFMICTTI